MLVSIFFFFTDTYVHIYIFQISSTSQSKLIFHLISTTLGKLVKREYTISTNKSSNCFVVQRNSWFVFFICS